MILVTIYLGLVGYCLYKFYSFCEEPLMHFIVGCLVTVTILLFMFTFFAVLL